MAQDAAAGSKLVGGFILLFALMRREWLHLGVLAIVAALWPVC
jgi:hypothetical protein